MPSRRLRTAIAIAVVCAWAPAARGEVIFDRSLGSPGPALPGDIGTTHLDYLLGADRGALRGDNLFFSFERFSIEADKLAAFDGPANVRNVLARVTGGELSRIDGGLGSAITGADVWLVNPSGVVFGPSSQLSLRGALHVSTGSYVRLADGSTFDARSADAGVLSTAAPEAFGFLGGEPGGIEVDVTGRTLRGRTFERMALVGGDVSIHGGAGGQIGYLWAQNGRIDLVGVASDGTAPVEVELYRDGGETLELHGPWQGRALVLDRDAVVSSSGVSPAGQLGAFQQGAGDIHVRGGSLRLDSAELRSPTGGSERGGDITIALSGDFVASNASRIGAGTGVLQGNTRLAGGGDGGDVSIDARDVSLLSGAQITTSSIWVGDAGNVRIHALDSLDVSGETPSGVPSGIFSRTEVSGAGGRIDLAAERLSLDGGVIVAETRGVAAGGAIDVLVGTLDIQGNGRIDSSTRGAFDPPAPGGMIDITARDWVRIRGRSGDDAFSGISAIAQGATDTLPPSTGRAGDIFLQSPLLVLSDGAEISTKALGLGDGGDITLLLGTLELDGGFVTASAVNGQGGDIRVRASRSATLRRGALVSASADGPGDAGSIELDAGQELVLDDGAITTKSAISNGGALSLRARKLISLYRSDVTTSVVNGTGGDIDIDPENMVLNQSNVLAEAGPGTGGNIRIVAGLFVMDAASRVSASAGPAGIDGTVTIESPEVDVTQALDTLPADYGDPANLLRAACAARTHAGAGSFAQHSTAPAAPPDAPLGARELETAREGCALESR